MFECLQAIIVDLEAAVEKYGGSVICLYLELDAREECQVFAEWCDELKVAAAGRQRHIGNSLMNLVMAFFWGWWWGHV